MRFDKRTRAVLIAALCVAAAPAAAQNQPGAPAPDPVADLLREAEGETYRRAPDSAQDPVEVKTTQALNAEITARNERAAAEDDANRRAFEAAQEDYAARLAAAQAEQARYENDVRAAEAARLRHEQEMADWRATVAACEGGDRIRCAAGSKVAPTY